MTPKFDVSQLYYRPGSSVVYYRRDASGYRGFDRDSRPILLTIGGSTTDQKYVSDNETWQFVLEAELGNKINVVNAGVDGQSTFGHLVSVRDWHSSEFKGGKVHGILFYFGVNDGRLLINGGIKLEEYYKSRDANGFSENLKNLIRGILSFIER